MRNFTAGEERNTERRGTAVGGRTRPRPFMLNKKLFGNYQTGFSLTVTHISSRSSPPPLFEAVPPPTPPHTFFVNAFNYPLGWKGHRSSQCRCPEVRWQFWNYSAQSGFWASFSTACGIFILDFFFPNGNYDFEGSAGNRSPYRENGWAGGKGKRSVWLEAMGWESAP